MKTTCILALAASLLTATAWAKGAPEQQSWVRGERSLEGDSTIYLSKKFVKKDGTFAATPESMQDKNTSISGSFLVGSYKYVYDRPAKESGQWVDELLMTDLLQCKDSYFGTLSRVKKYKGKEVARSQTAEADLSLMQMRGQNIGSQLCELHSKGNVAGTRQQPNPSYRGGQALTDKEADKLIDKYK
jgi:hypothetical protein